MNYESAVLIITLMIVLLLGMVPGAIAGARRHRNTTAISVCGMLGVFTVILWLVAFIWAFTDNRRI